MEEGVDIYGMGGKGWGQSTQQKRTQSWFCPPGAYNQVGKHTNSIYLINNSKVTAVLNAKKTKTR